MRIPKKFIVFLLLVPALAACRSERRAPTIEEEAARIDAGLTAIVGSLERLRAEAARVATDPALLGVPLEPGRIYAFLDNTLYYQWRKDGKSSILSTGRFPADEAQIARLRRLEHLEPVLAREAASHPWISMDWFATPESLGVFYPPWDMAAFVPPRLDVTIDILPYRRAVEGNPGRAPVWVEPYVDITGKGYMVTVSAPVGASGVLLGVVGHDVALEPLARLFRGEGYENRLLLTRELYVVAGGEEALRPLGLRALGEYYYLRRRDRDIEAPGRFRLTAHENERIRAAAARIAGGEREIEIPLDGRRMLLRAAPIAGAGWFLAEVVSR